MKAFADDNSTVAKTLAKIMDFVFDQEEKHRKGENAGYRHFLLFPPCFQRSSLFGLFKPRNCVVKS